MEDYDAYRLIKRFQQLQEERVHTYHLFNEGHKLYLGSGPDFEFLRFQQLVHEVTQEFKRISEGIIAIEKQLRAGGHTKVSNFIKAIQEEEKNKLQLTAGLQLAKQGLNSHPDEPERELHVLSLKQRLHVVMESINAHLEEVRYEAAEL